MDKQRARQLYELADRLSKLDVNTLSEQQLASRNSMIAKLQEEVKSVAEGIMNTIANKVMGAAPEQPKYKVGQRVKYETSPHQPDWKDGGRGVGVITAYKNGHYMINGNPVNHFEIKGVVDQGVAEAEKNPHTSALGKALHRDLSKEKKASPAQVEKNKARWAQRQADKEQGVAEGHDSEDLANEVYAEFERIYPNLARRVHERTIHAAIMDVLNYGGDNDPGVLAQDVARAVKQQMQQGVAEGEQRMSRAAMGHEKYGKEGMQALAKAGREGASEKTLDAIRDKHNKYDESIEEAEKKGLYYYVNKRKKAGTSRDADSPKAPTAQAWKDAAKTAKESVSEEFNGEYDDEAGMAESNLHTMARAVNGLLDTIQDNDNLPEWAQEKIAKAEMMVTSVWDYLLSQKEQGMDPKVQGVAEAKKPSPKLTPVNIKKTEAVSEEINTEAYERLQKVFAFKNYES